jgi:hypothetical protein
MVKREIQCNGKVGWAYVRGVDRTAENKTARYGKRKYTMK